MGKQVRSELAVTGSKRKAEDSMAGSTDTKSKSRKVIQSNESDPGADSDASTITGTTTPPSGRQHIDGSAAESNLKQPDSDPNASMESSGAQQLDRKGGNSSDPKEALNGQQPAPGTADSSGSSKAPAAPLPRVAFDTTELILSKTTAYTRAANDHGHFPCTVSAVELKRNFKVPAALTLIESLHRQESTRRHVNIGRIDPRVMRLVDFNRTNYVGWGKSSRPATFFIIGACCFSSLFTGARRRQISVIPSDVVWNRAVDVLGTVSGERQLFFSSYFNGLSFASRFKPADKPAVSLVGVTESKKFDVVTSKTAASSFPVSAWDADVPVFEEFSEFTPSQINGLTRRSTEVDVNSAVLVTFTVSFYAFSGSSPDPGMPLKKAVSLNVQQVVVIAKPPRVQRHTDWPDDWSDSDKGDDDVATLPLASQPGDPSNDSALRELALDSQPDDNQDIDRSQAGAVTAQAGNASSDQPA